MIRTEITARKSQHLLASLTELLLPTLLTLILWSGQSSSEQPLKVKAELRLPHRGPVVDIAFRPDGKYIATASWDHTAKLWDARTGKLIHQLDHQYWVEELVFSPDGNLLFTATGNVQPQVRVYDLTANPPTYVSLKLPWGASSIAYSPASRLILERNFKSGVSAWDFVNKKRVWGPIEQPIRHRPDSGWSPLVVASRRDWVFFYLDQSIQVREAKTGKLIKTLPLPFPIHTDFKFTHDESLVAVPRVRQLYIYRLPELELYCEPLNHPEQIRTLATAKRHPWIAAGTCGRDTAILVWNYTSGKPVLEKHIRIAPEDRTTDDGVLWLEFSPDDSYLVSIDTLNYGQKQFLRVWSIKTGAQVSPTFESKDIIKKAVFSPDGKSLAVAYYEGRASIYLWETR